MKICEWAFVVEGPSASLECLPKESPWWSLSFRGEDADWEAWIATEQGETDIERQLDAAMEAIVKMNGIAVSMGHHGLIKMSHHVAYDADGIRTKTIPLRIHLTVTKLSGFGPTPPASIGFSAIDAGKLQTVGTLLEYWGQPNAETYEGLYKIFEVIQAADPKLTHTVSETKIRQLKHTCNCVTSGPTARHARLRGDPVADPMPLAEIRQIVKMLSDLYIKSISQAENSQEHPAA